MSHQLPLDLEAPDRYSRDRFIATPPLHDVLSLLSRGETWLSPHLILQGATGSGKTHLGHIFITENNGLFMRATDTHHLDPARLEVRPYLVDDAELANEEALFHLSNHVQKHEQKLVLTTKMQPLMWKTLLPDLASRLRAMRLIVLPEPDEALLTGIFYKLFAERAISPSADCIDYLVRRMDRSVGAAQKIVTDLQHYANGRPFNRLLARNYMDTAMGGGRISLFDEPDTDDGFDSF